MAYFARLRARNSFVVAVLAFAAAGCNIHPLPDNLSRATTYDIVARVRCEVQQALRELGDLKTQKEREHAQYIINNSAIGFDFLFDIVEFNDIASRKEGVPGAAATYTRPSHIDATKGLTLDFSATTARKRQNKRRFRVVEDLKEMNGDDPKCLEQTTTANLVYPVVGATGMGEVVKTYVRLEILTDFQRLQEIDLAPGLGVGPKLNIGKSIAFSDALQFTTDLTAGINPKLTIRTIAGDLRLTNASLFGEVGRKDVHTVIVALASDAKDLDDVPPPPKRKEMQSKEAHDKEVRYYHKRIRISKARRQIRNIDTRTIQGVARDPRTATALVQSKAGARANVLMELERVRSLDEDEREEARRLGERLLLLLREPD